MAVKELVVITAAGTPGLGAPGLGAPLLPPGTQLGAALGVSQILANHAIVLAPMFASPPGGAYSAAGADPTLSRYFRVQLEQTRAEALARDLLNSGLVEAAYTRPAVENPLAPEYGRPPKPYRDPNGIPDFTSKQLYLFASPHGVDAHAAWKEPGGKGRGVSIIDIEGGWCLGHRDFGSRIQLRGGQNMDDVGWRNHGTAVLGEIAGDASDFGVVGIAPEATVSVISHSGPGPAKAITDAAGMLAAGDIILLEMHSPGPRHNFEARQDQLGYVAVEWWPDCFAAVRFATSRGIIVVSAAGNGAENLDDPIYDKPGQGFPATWKNPFRRGQADSGSVVCGAGAPPSGDYGPDRSRLDFSNYGALVDAQGWGRGVVTTGYGDLHGAREEEWYTATFAGTSSASPIVVGALACLQGIAKSRGRLINGLQARELLRAFGAPQTWAPGSPQGAERIGNRPDLAKMMQRV